MGSSAICPNHQRRLKKGEEGGVKGKKEGRMRKGGEIAVYRRYGRGERGDVES